MNKLTKTGYITYGAVIAAVYAILTLLSGALGLGYGAIQLRVSEALCILPVFTAVAIPGLTVGCVIANIFSFNPIDMLVGTAGTLIAALLSRAFRKIKFKGLPLLSLLPPVVVNAVLVGVELAVLYFPREAFLESFAVCALEIAAGQFIVCYGLGLPLYSLLKKKNIF